MNSLKDFFLRNLSSTTLHHISITLCRDPRSVTSQHTFCGTTDEWKIDRKAAGKATEQFEAMALKAEGESVAWCHKLHQAVELTRIDATTLDRNLILSLVGGTSL